MKRIVIITLNGSSREVDTTIYELKKIFKNAPSYLKRFGVYVKEE